MLAAQSAIRLDTSKEILTPQVRAAFPLTVLAAMIALASRGRVDLSHQSRVRCRSIEHMYCLSVYVGEHRKPSGQSKPAE